MTDAEIVRACGEAMRWVLARVYDQGVYNDDSSSIEWCLPHSDDENPKVVAPRDWNPLTSDTDCMQLVDLMADQDYWMEVGTNRHAKVWWCSTDGGITSEEGSNRRRVTCIAILKAKGLWKEGK